MESQRTFKSALRVLFLGFMLSSFCGSAGAKDFKNIAELISISLKNPSDLEKALIEKGYKYDETNNGRFEFSNKYNSSYISYELAPRVLQYNFADRQFYLDAFTKLQKMGYTLSKGSVKSIINSQTYEAELFSKKSASIYLYQYGSSGSESYSILLYPGTDALVKANCSYSNIFAGLMMPKGFLSQAPVNQSFEKTFAGNGGLGGTNGYEFGFSGLAGFVKLNQKLPEFIDFGLHLEAVAGFQPYALLSKDYKYKNFTKYGVGGGPALSIKPFSNSDLRFTVFYDFFALGNGGGNISYTGSVPNYTATITRKSPSFAMMKSLGFELKFQSIFIGMGFANYTDKGEFEKKAGYTGSVTTTQIKASLPMKQTIVKLGFNF